MSVKIALIEDHAGTLEALSQLIDGWPNLACVGRYLTAAEAIDKAPDAEPEVVLVDLELGAESGVECIRQLKVRLPRASILVFSRHDEPDWLFPALQAGASGYLLKDSAPSALLDGILAAHRGEAPMSSAIARKVLAYFRQGGATAVGLGATPRTGRPAAEPNAASSLRRDEELVLELLAGGRNTNEAAAELGVSLRTVSYRLERIKAKLHARTSAQAVAKYVARRREGGGPEART